MRIVEPSRERLSGDDHRSPAASPSSTSVAVDVRAHADDSALALALPTMTTVRAPPVP
jgi:hypothetical protein